MRDPAGAWRGGARCPHPLPIPDTLVAAPNLSCSTSARGARAQPGRDARENPTQGPPSSPVEGPGKTGEGRCWAGAGIRSSTLEFFCVIPHPRCINILRCKDGEVRLKRGQGTNYVKSEARSKQQQRWVRTGRGHRRGNSASLEAQLCHRCEGRCSQNPHPRAAGRPERDYGGGTEVWGGGLRVGLCTRGSTQGKAPKRPQGRTAPPAVPGSAPHTRPWGVPEAGPQDLPNPLRCQGTSAGTDAPGPKVPRGTGPH